MKHIDEFQLRHLARNLEDLYHQLHVMKQAHPPRPEARIMKPTPGPRTPGNWLAIATYTEQEQRLREVAFNAFSDINLKLKDTDAAAPRLCHLIAYHAQPIAHLDWAADLAEELQHQTRTISQHCNPPTTTTLKRAERIKAHLANKYLPPLDKP